MDIEEIKQQEKEDKELYENFPKWEQEYGQVLSEFWCFYFLVTNSDLEQWDKVPYKLKNCWIRTAQALIKTVLKPENSGPGV